METWPNHIIDPFIQFDWHTGLFWVPPAPLPVPGASWHIAAGTHFMPEIKLGEAKSNGWEVLADHVPVVSRGHECAYLVMPHFNIGPFPGINVMTPFLILGSSTKCEFAVGSVRCKDGPIAVSLFKALGIDWSCQDVGVKLKFFGNTSAGFYGPTCAVSNYSTVDIGFTFGDLVASLLCAAFDSLVQAVTSVLFSKIVDVVFDNKMFKWLFDKMIKPEIMSLLRSMDIPTRFRDEKGRFASMSTEMAKEMTNFILGEAASPYVDKITNAMNVTGDDGWANRIGAHLDGNAELLGY